MASIYLVMASATKVVRKDTLVTHLETHASSACMTALPARK